MTITKINYPEFELSRKFSSHVAYPIAEDWLKQLIELPGVQQGEISGELRRGMYAIEQIGIALSARDPQNVLNQISEMGEDILDLNNENISLLLPSGLNLTIWASLPEHFGGLLLRTTGSENHLKALSQAAERSGMQFERLLEHEREEDIYSPLGLAWIPPELRESGNEVRDPEGLDLEHLIHPKDVQSDLHMHTTWTDGKNSVEEMVQAAIQHGLSTIAITDHSPFLLKQYHDASYFYDQAREIDEIQKKYQDRIQILQGAEVDILPDGTLDLPEALLKRLDVVVASMHFELNQPVEQSTERLLRAIESPYVNIIGHPGGRMNPTEDVFELDWDKVYPAAARHQVALEINSHRSDSIFEDTKARVAAAEGVMIAINSDSHRTTMIFNAHFGISLACRAGLNRSQVINTWPIDQLKQWLKHKKESTAGVR